MNSSESSTAMCAALENQNKLGKDIYHLYNHHNNYQHYHHCHQLLPADHGVCIVWKSMVDVVSHKFTRLRL